MNIDYHVAFEGHYYSVSHQHVGAAVELRITAATLEVLLRRQRIAAHARSAKAAASTLWPSTCRRRTGRTGSGRRLS